jgi:hypothetical protein
LDGLPETGKKDKFVAEENEKQGLFSKLGWQPRSTVCCLIQWIVPVMSGLNGQDCLFKSVVIVPNRGLVVGRLVGMPSKIESSLVFWIIPHFVSNGLPIVFIGGLAEDSAFRSMEKKCNPQFF